MRRYILLFGAFILFTSNADVARSQDSVYVARGHILFQENPPDRRRLILEPGTPLLKLGEVDTDIGKLYRVRTSTGITGLMRKLDVEEIDSSSPVLGFVKNDFNHKGIHMSAGEVHPVERKEFPDETVYEISKGIARYDIRTKAYTLTTSKIELSADEISRFINIVDFNRLKAKRFPTWVQLSHQGHAGRADVGLRRVVYCYQFSESQGVCGSGCRGVISDLGQNEALDRDQCWN